MDDIPTTSLENVYRSNVDTTRPFRSVKEAVEIFGERFLAGEIYAPKPFTFPKPETPVCFYTPSPSPQKSQDFTSSSRSMESVISGGGADQNHHGFAEELKKLAAELEDTRAEVRRLKERESETEVAVASLNAELHKNRSKMAAAEAAAAAEVGRRKKGTSPSLAQMLSGSAAAKKVKVKKKPIVPLVGDLLFWKKGSSSPSSTNSVLNPLFSSPHRRNI